MLEVEASSTKCPRHMTQHVISAYPGSSSLNDHHHHHHHHHQPLSPAGHDEQAMSQPERAPLEGLDTSLSSNTQDNEQGVLQTPSQTASGPQTTSIKATTAGSKDFSFLLRPEIYHALKPLNVPPAFRDSSKQPEPDARLDQLLERGQFRAAAIAAVQELTGSGGQGTGVDVHDVGRIFDLLYTRLACLTLIDATPLAAQEVKALEDLNSVRMYVDDASGEHLAPWPLRLLNVRLQALGFGDARRAVMSYHDLAREARLQIGKSKSRNDDDARTLWTARLHHLAIHVAGALVDMDDLAGAAHHLDSLPDTAGGPKLALCRALLWLQIGDAERARQYATLCARDADKVMQALCDMAEADYEAALAKWQNMETDDDEMVAVNKAICLLYLGRMNEGRHVLEGMVVTRASSHALLFNLSTMYELCTDKHRELKMKLAERVAGLDESPAGWERVNGDFKL
ncbi:hypothetical protein XA68_16964 [Ophiocordyceps unilateralis]|uniref:Trafficking protein particle complex subunit 12 n=1 Tax=Ophiocordyceps unilateralis TaxID=268505 RepID=A0A2A9P3V5_OPHUN|nr:hypothetical protein XA68_16964 [Ophiocordyceps unilateralis]